MKLCESCGAKNATRAQFCSTCGAKFRIVDAEPANDAKKKPQVSVEKKTAGAVVASETESERRRRERIEAATARLGAVVWSGIVAVARFLGRALAPIAQWTLNAARNSIARGLAPSSTWDPTKPPNFIYWAIVDCLVFQLPFSVIAIVYCVLSNTARKEEQYESATWRAETAKNWLLIDFAVGVVVLVLRKLVLN